jgi:hypothetical protein
MQQECLQSLRYGVGVSESGSLYDSGVHSSVCESIHKDFQNVERWELLAAEGE